ncbi:MAG: hypothetical protein ACREV9_13080 [Burkholderiales bacterium]
MSVSQLGAGAHESLVVEHNAGIREPCRIRFGTDEEEKMANGPPRLLAGRTVTPANCFQYAAFALKTADLGLRENLDVGKRGDPLD